MESTIYTDRDTLYSAIEANHEAFHKRLQHLYPCVDDVTKLPQAWQNESKSTTIGLTFDKLGCYFRGNCPSNRDEDDKCSISVRTDHYIPPSCLLYYFEIEFVSKGREGLMGVGLTSAQVSLTKLPGMARESYGYHADGGNTYNGDIRGIPFGPTFTSGDVIGCGINLVEGKCFFTRNGVNLGKAFEDVPSSTLFYPTIGLKTPGEEIKANFGQEEFVYDIEQDLRSLRKNMTLTITNYPTADFETWQDTLHKLVQSWLLQNSYPNTAEAFTRLAYLDYDEDPVRVQERSRIQNLILQGRISEAIRLTQQLYPSLLQNNPNLLFVLKCRQFIELISGAESDYQPIFNYSANYNSEGGDLNGLNNKNYLANNDQSVAPYHVAKASNSENGCNGLVETNCGEKVENQLSTQELMDIDQPIMSSSTSSDNSNNHQCSPTLRNNGRSSHLHPKLQQMTSQDQVETDGNEPVYLKVSNPNCEENELKLARLLRFGRELSNYLQQLEKLYGINEMNEKMLHDAISLIAYTNPKNSYFGKLLDPSEREPVSQLLISSIVKVEMGDSYRSPLEGVMNHLRKLVRLNDSYGKWIIDRLY